MKLRHFMLLAVVLCALTSCHKAPTTDSHDRAVYYWRTTFTLDDAERKFLSDNDINKIYLRYFDVVYDRDARGAVPNATIRWIDSVPRGVDVVPTVFILPEAAIKMDENLSEYVPKFIDRIEAMSHSQNLDINEIQLDCDWTGKSRSSFFRFCEAVRDSLATRGIKLSATIRLHQLTQDPPPVDRGVLMMYNTGSVRSVSVENSIFSKRDIAPYLADNRLRNYDLPLDVAWPVYGWGVAFDDDNKFAGLLTLEALEKLAEPDGDDDDPTIIKATPSRYNVKHYLRVGDNYIYNGSVRVERPTARDIADVKALVDKQLGQSHANIIYHLDSKQLSNYTDNEIKNIFSID